MEGFGVGERVVVDPNIPCRTCEYCHDSRPHLCVRPQALGVTLNGGYPSSRCYPHRRHTGCRKACHQAAALTEPLACTLHAVDVGAYVRGNAPWSSAPAR